MARSLWVIVIFKNPLLWALYNEQLPLELYVHILKLNGFATSQVYKSQPSPINVYFYNNQITSKEKQVVSRYNREENTSLPVDVHCSNTSLLKLSIIILLAAGSV